MTEIGRPRSRQIERLRSLRLFSTLGDEALAVAAERTAERFYPRGSVVFRKGEICHGLYLVLEGQVKIYRASPDGREQVLHIEGPGSPLAELPRFAGGPYLASARNIKDQWLLFRPHDAPQVLDRQTTVLT